jgi:hypothetical protein
MTDPKDRDSGAKPSGPAPGDSGYLPPRLRDKLGKPPEEPPKRSPAGLIIGVVVVVILIVAGWWFMNQRAKAQEEAAREAARAQAIADSIAAVRRADSLAAVARADSIEAFNALPRWRQRQVLIQQARERGEVIDPGPFVIDAGEFLFEGAAREAAEALRASTDLSARVSRAGGVYHVYLGRFETRAAARRAASNLTSRGLVELARVIPAP